MPDLLTPEIVERAAKSIYDEYTGGLGVWDKLVHKDDFRNAALSALEAVIPSLIEECAKVAERKIKERARDSTVYMGGPSEYQKGRESMNHDISITVPTAIRSLIPSKEKQDGGE